MFHKTPFPSARIAHLSAGLADSILPRPSMPTKNDLDAVLVNSTTDARTALRHYGQECHDAATAADRALIDKFSDQLRVQEDRTLRNLQDAHTKLDSVPPTRSVMESTNPWSFSSKAIASGYVLAATLLLFSGVSAAASVLLDSGIAFSKMQALMMALPVGAVPFAIAGLAQRWSNDSTKRLYISSVYSAVILSGFALVFVSAALSGDDGGGWLDTGQTSSVFNLAMLQTCLISATEIFGSTLFKISVDRKFSEHRTYACEPTPEYSQLQDDVRQISDELTVIDQALAGLQGRKEALNADREGFVSIIMSGFFGANRGTAHNAPPA